MLRALLPFPPAHPQRWLFGAVALATAVAVPAAVYSGKNWLYGIPAALLVFWLAMVDFRKIFFLMLAAIPISTEAELPGGLSTDLPSEPLMWLLTLVSGAWFLRNWRKVDGRFLRHPITLFLFLHLSWIAIAAITSQQPVVSLKFLAAKGWYVIVFYFLASRFLQEERDYKALLWWFFLPLLFATLYVLYKHSATGFEFRTVNYVMGPFFRNHVMYACVLAFFLPFLWYGTYWYQRWSMAWWLLVGGILVFLVGINFAYTRAAYVALLVAVGVRWAVRHRLLKAALLSFGLILTLMIGWITYRDNWLRFKPDFSKTITHITFDNLLEATTKLQDISTMERVYRWVAASYMIRDRPGLGFGPGTFYFHYKNYTVSAFKTYVSDNEERSGMHNYYLMTTVEQGIPGAVIFLAFCVFVLLRGERIYHQTAELRRRRVLITALLCFALIDLLMLMNDFVETDKIGSLFFMSLAMMVNIDLQNKGQEAEGRR